MYRQFKNWLQGKSPVKHNRRKTDLRRSGAYESPAPAPKKEPATVEPPEFVDPDPTLEGNIEENGPGKNVLVRNKYVREETGTYETLKIVDDSVVDSGEETGIDPYNTGDFDRSKNWDKRFRN